MSQDNPIRVFASHAFQEHDDYYRLFEYLESTTKFFYANSAIPGKVPDEDTEEALKDELREQIEPAEIVIILAGLYDEFHEWIDFTLLLAKSLDKPVIAIEHFGSTQEIAPEIAEIADEVVAWNERSIVDAVRRHARQEETHRWDVIEFEMPESE